MGKQDTQGVKITSKKAYHSIKRELGERQKEVFLALKIIQPANNRMIAEYLKKPINTIVPRIHELRIKKLVGVDSTGIDPVTARSTILWKCVK